MTIIEMQKQKYAIILEALIFGVPIKYGDGWQLIFQNGIIYEVSYNIQNEKVVRKSTITLQEFISNFKEITDANLKRIFGDIRLHKLQKRLMDES